MTRRTMSLGLVAVFVALALPVPADAQIPKPSRVLSDTRNQIRSSIEGVFGDAVACAFNDEECIEDAKENGDEVVLVNDEGNVITDKDGNPITDPDAAAAANEEPGTGRWNNYDYVRGETPMYNTWWNILDEENPPTTMPNPEIRVGRIPPVVYGAGTMQYVHLRGIGALELTSRASFQVHLDEPLSVDRGFSLEITYHTPRNTELDVYFEPVDEQAGADRKFGEDLQKHFVQLAAWAQISHAYNAGSDVSSGRDTGARDGFVTAEIQISDGGYTLIYVNGERLAQIPDFVLPESSNVIEFFAQASERSPLYIADIRVDYGISDPVKVAEGLAAEEPEPYVTRSIFFDFDSADIRPESTPELARIHQMLMAYDGRVVIEGHTDRVGSDDYNMELSQERADAVKAYLVELGVPADRMDAVGKGESELLSSGEPEPIGPELHEQDRRVVVAPTM
ncbi:MAG: OmpA family protein [Gemmatimonadetes bacterium]|nr:OmpA family protein [Gemmatimonadota bacterium]